MSITLYIKIHLRYLLVQCTQDWIWKVPCFHFLSKFSGGHFPMCYFTSAYVLQNYCSSSISSEPVISKGATNTGFYFIQFSSCSIYRLCSHIHHFCNFRFDSVGNHHPIPKWLVSTGTNKALKQALYSPP